MNFSIKKIKKEKYKYLKSYVLESSRKFFSFETIKNIKFFKVKSLDEQNVTAIWYGFIFPYRNDFLIVDFIGLPIKFYIAFICAVLFCVLEFDIAGIVILFLFLILLNILIKTEYEDIKQLRLKFFSEKQEND